MVAVPTHFFKVVLAERGTADDSNSTPDAVVGAFVIPNAPVQADMPLTAFSVPLGILEEAAGEVSSHLSHQKAGTLGHVPLPDAGRLVIGTGLQLQRLVHCFLS
jgi:DNA/RNA endonuclease G (NUC1)